jgi:hypothetical protein
MTRSEVQAILADKGYEAAYAAVYPQWERGISQLPERFRGGVIRHVLFGIEGGNFLNAVMESNLFSAIGRADLDSIDCLPAICRFMYNFAPSDSFGTKEKVEAWLSKGGALGRD